MIADTRLTQEVKKLKVDSLYGKKIHFNAAIRNHRWHCRLGVTVLVVSTIVGSSLFALLGRTIPEPAKWCGAGLSLIAALAAGIQTFFHFEKQAHAHNAIGLRYLSLAKRCSRLLAAYGDETVTGIELRNELEKIAREYDAVTGDAAALSVSRKDYLKARKGFQEGEESYTERELEGF